MLQCRDRGWGEHEALHEWQQKPEGLVLGASRSLCLEGCRAGRVSAVLLAKVEGASPRLGRKLVSGPDNAVSSWTGFIIGTVEIPPNT